ncbi:mediator complex subunit 7 [Oratosquilla oratoria]|uniref:mediator complex subunit 7 n=1 Tax=Oratosquilla oratoria TaxID=337810 RepID=UPI003F758056
MALPPETELKSTFPLPPTQYLSQYTDENIRRGRAPKLPPVMHSEYTMFGVPFNADDAIIRPLESQSIRRLYPQSFDHRRELKKLNHSILVNFLDLLDLLIKCPDANKRTDKIDDINILFINMHHLINEFRPHQARETVRVMLEMQKRQRYQVNERLEKQEEEVRKLVGQALSSLPDNLDLDSKLLVPTPEEQEMRCKPDGSTVGQDKVSTLDRLMCHIVDSL